jgi:CHAT domain-containing protein
MYRAGLALFENKNWEQADYAYKAAVEELDPSDIAGVFWIWYRATALLREGDLKAADARYEEADRKIGAAVAGAAPLVVYNLFYRYLLAVQRGDLGRAEAYASQAEEIQRKTQPKGESYLFLLGYLALTRGDIVKAEDYYRRQLTRTKRSRSEFSRMTAWLGLGEVAWARGDLDRADKYIASAQNIAEREFKNSLDAIYEMHGLIARDGGRFDEAGTYFKRALDYARKASEDSVAVVGDYNHLGVLYELKGDLDQAESYLRKALEICLRKWPDSTQMAWIQSDLADTLQKRGHFEQAESYYREALAKFRGLAPGSKDHAEVLGALASLMRRSDRSEAAASFYQQALAVLENQTAKLGGSGDDRAGFLAKHENYYREYIDLLVFQHKQELAFDVLERSRARILLETLAAAHIDIRKGADPDLLAQKRSLQANIKAKSERRISLLSDKHSDEQLKAVEKEISDLTAEYQDIESQIRSTSPSYAALTQPQPLSAKEIQRQLLDPDTMLLEYSLGEERGYVFAVTPVSLRAFELPKRAQIEQAARHAYKLLTAAKRNSATVTPAQKQARAQSEYRLQQALDELSGMILGPVATQLAGKRLLIVPDGALHYIPFQVLPEPRQGPETRLAAPLVAQHEIINLPSASVLAVLRQQQMNRPEAAKAVAVLADPVFAKDDPRLLHSDPSAATGSLPVTRNAKVARSRHELDDLLDTSFSTGVLTRSAAEVGLTRGNRLALPRLRFSRQEANAILAVTPPGLGLKALDFRASRATATSPELSQYRIVHFATHGLLNSEHPEFSGLVLSLVDAKGKQQEGFLELEDIYNLNLHADLVVLSACETGLGKEISGEGLVGLTRGFMYAGASRVVASLWKVSDVATAKLMAEFYRAMEKDGLAPAAALRQAQVEMWKQPQWRSPYYWAAFQLQGEWK